MKVKHFVASLLILILGMVLTGCAGTKSPTSDRLDTAACSNSNANAMLQSGDYQEKINNFLIIEDASSSMGERQRELYTSELLMKSMASYTSKLELSKDLLTCLNNTLPDNFDVTGGMRIFGVQNGLINGMSKYDKEALGGAVNSLGKTGGTTPIANAITNGSADLSELSGNTAVIIFSDGNNTVSSNPVSAAAEMKALYGDNVCIYTVHIGEEPKGKMTLEQIADAGTCGFATDSKALVSAAGMDKFVTDVFLTEAPKKPALAAAPAPAPVMKKPEPVMKKPVEKVTMTLYFEFDFDKAVVRPQYHGDAKKIADSMIKYPEANVLLEGYTDDRGSDEYNMSLSRRRADSVKMYLVEKFNVDASRISTVGYGKSNPIASNDTDAGRQTNRRVVANIE